MAKRKVSSGHNDGEATVIVTIGWSEDKFEELADRKSYGENIDFDHGLGYIIIKYFDKNPDVKEKERDCINFEDNR